MEVVIVKMPLVDYQDLSSGFSVTTGNWLIKEQYLETEEILDKERELNMALQKVRDLRKEFNELKHPK